MAVAQGVDRRANGGAVAALLGAAFGLFALGLVVLGSELSAGVEGAVFALGASWMPGASGLGAYSGKETVLLLTWLGSWAVLHLAIRRREMRLERWLVGACALVFVATLLVWPPVWRLFGA